MSSDPVARTLEHFFQSLDDVPCKARVLVAFSGGPDSTALLAGLVRVAPRLGFEVLAAHFDHALDPDSGRRAEDAHRMAEEIGVPLTFERRSSQAPKERDGVEAAARRARYDFLSRRAAKLGARFIATAHHAGDQAETVILRLAFGSGLEGLAGIRPVRRLSSGVRLIRPLLDLDRRALAKSLVSQGVTALEDPTNQDLAVPRNRIRHLLVPRLEQEDPEIGRRLAGLATTAAAATRHLDALLSALLSPGPVPHEPGVQVSRRAFEALPRELVAHALAMLHRRAGVNYPAGAEARRELERQIAKNRGPVGCDCGGGWRWEAASGVLQLVRHESSAAEFAYTVDAPGEVDVPELGLTLRLRRGRVAPWMFLAWPDRAGLADSPPAGGSRRFEVRSRRPGDRMTPLGRRRTRRLKDLFIDRRVPRRQRGRVPLLVADGEIAWVPGLAVAERFRIDPGENGRVWIAEIDSSPSGNEGT